MNEMQGKLYEDIFFEVEDSDGNFVEDLVEDDALAMLLLAGHIFVLPADAHYDNRLEAAGMYVNCNDTFFWATADMEPLPVDEIGNLYKLCFDKDGNPLRFGSTVWACLRRKMRPQHPLEKMIKKVGAWTKELEALPVREFTG